MTPFSTFLLVLLLAAFLHTTIYYTYFWQLKEYRWDRMRDFLGTASGERKIFNWIFWLKFLAIILFLCSLFIIRYWNFGSDGKAGLSFGIWMSGKIYWLIIGTAVLELLEAMYRLLKRKFYRPDKTVKAFLVMFFTVLWIPVFCELIALGTNSTWDWSLVWLVTLMAYVVSPTLNALSVGIFYPITVISKAVVLRRAHSKIAQMQGLKVIAITGSYGKSSVKEILAHILGEKYQVLKTPGNTNTEIGVAGIVLKHLRADDQVFIVEAGAYKIGEIRKIAEMVNPRIGIITAVKDAHLAMFGSLENIKKAKFELIESLPEFGTAIFNANNEGASDLAGRADKMKLGKVIRCGNSGKTDLKATDIEETVDGLKFKIDGVEFAAGVPGQHNVENILAAVAAALEMDMALPEIAERVKKIKLREHTLTVLKPSEGLVLIDDTYNANPDGVVAGLNYLKLYKDWQKIVVFPGMLELGKESSAEHQRVAEKMGQFANEVFLTSKDFEKPLLEGFQKAHFTDYLFLVENPKELLAELRRRIANRQTVILFISRGSESVLKQLQSKKSHEA